MWPEADVEQYKRDVQVAGLRTDSEHLRWFAAHPSEVEQLPGGKWRCRAEGVLASGVYEGDDLISALVYAKEAWRIRELHAARR